MTPIGQCGLVGAAMLDDAGVNPLGVKRLS